MGDIGEGSSVDNSRGVLEGLHQVGHEGVLQKDCHGARDLDVLRRDPAAPEGGPDDDAVQSGLEIFDVGGQTQYGHHLGGDGYVKTGFALDPLPPDRW